jgi:hypothetical protein
MILRFLDHQDETNPINGLVIADDEQLLKILDGFRTREPFFAEFHGDNGYKLLIGIGRTVGCVQYSRSDDDAPYLMAVARDPRAEEKSFEFLAGNTPTPVPGRYILPLEQVKKIAQYFRETGARSASVSWEEI